MLSCCLNLETYPTGYVGYVGRGEGEVGRGEEVGRGGEGACCSFITVTILYAY